jgi:hypothetical protein
MREFFKMELQVIAINGIRQAEFLLPDQITLLLDELVKVSGQYSSIPPEDQKSIIRRQIIEDKKLKEDGGLTPRKLHQWFYAAKLTGKYDPKEQTEDVPSADPEKADEYAKQLLSQIAASSNHKISHVTKEDVDSLKKEDEERCQGQKALSIGYKSPSPEWVKARELHIEYLRQQWKHSQDPINYEGQKLVKEFMTEEEWLALQKIETP